MTMLDQDLMVVDQPQKRQVEVRNFGVAARTETVNPEQVEREQEKLQQEQITNALSALPIATCEMHQVLHQVVSGIFRDVPMLRQEDALDFVNAFLKPFCDASSHNYFLIMLLLKLMSDEQEAGRCIGHPMRKIMETLEKSYEGTDQAEEARSLSDALKFHRHSPAEVERSISNIRKAQALPLSKGDVNSLYAIYYAHVEDMLLGRMSLADKPQPSIDSLREEFVFEALINHCFLEDTDTKNDYEMNSLRSCLWLLAYASCGLLPDENGKVDYSDVEPMYNKLQQLYSLLQNIKNATEFKANIKYIFRVIGHPILCACLLTWIKKTFFQADFLFCDRADRFEDRSVFALPQVVNEIAIQHVYLRSKIFDVWTVALGFVYMKDDTDSETVVAYKKIFMEQTLVLIRLGYIKPIFHYFLNSNNRIDHSLLAYFVRSVILNSRRVFLY